VPQRPRSTGAAAYIHEQPRSKKKYDEAKNQYPCGGILLSSVRNGLQEESGSRTASATTTNCEAERAIAAQADDLEFHGVTPVH
jgi:hypothetical protein